MLQADAITGALIGLGLTPSISERVIEALLACEDELSGARDITPMTDGSTSLTPGGIAMTTESSGAREAARAVLLDFVRDLTRSREHVREHERNVHSADDGSNDLLTTILRTIA